MTQTYELDQTVTGRLSRDDPGLRRVGRLMRAVGVAGVLAGVIAVAVSLWLLHDLDTLLGRSLRLTSESLTTVDSALTVAADSVAVVGDGLADAETTSRGLKDSLAEGADLLDQTARLTRNDIARSLESFERSMPALIEVSGTVDTTLRAVDRLPIGPTYDPDEPFDESLRELQKDLKGLPDDLRAQADTIEAAGGNLDAVGDQSVQIAGSIADVRASLDDAGRVLDEYRSTTSRTRDLLEQTEAELTRRIWVLRGMVVVLGAIYCFGQLLPIHLGNRMTKTFVPESLDR